MTGPTRTGWATLAADEERYRPLYARVLGLRFVNPGGVLCFLFFEGAVALAALLALAELVSWWSVLLLPAAVAVMVKLNDVVAASVVRSASLVPEQERDRFRRQMEPAVGRAPVPARVTRRSGRQDAAPVNHPVDPETGRAWWIPGEVVSTRQSRDPEARQSRVPGTRAGDGGQGRRTVPGRGNAPERLAVEPAQGHADPDRRAAESGRWRPKPPRPTRP
ncbi:hypothetical protein GA0074692_6593 [Micromonospora pallida]|uniref:Uncharacterized protein n=1 Tax=Micromonospora pallida TaxID=145854 RepID=A0A1C6TJP9_9ACTN|nr:hypothetical protein [Micromonospora pallida]SCL41978.1 hypothetical protein GA0074692_6593 [Micromonospora pallida]